MQVHVAEGRVHTSETVDACSMRPCVCQMRDDESNEVGASSMENIDYEASHFVRWLPELDGDVSFIWNWIKQKDKSNCKHLVAVEQLRGRRITSMQG